MTIDTKDLLNSILTSLSCIDYVKPEDLPNIDLYMDQVTTFMDQQLSSFKRREHDKILTKTMINNYVKNNLMPPPVKKKYTKEHLLLLIFIYYFKNILSISDIQAILNPVSEKYFGSKDDFSLEEIYAEVFCLEKTEVNHLQKDIARRFEISRTTFNLDNLDEDDRQDMQLFAFICMLCFDVYVKKSLIENLLDAKSTSLAEEQRDAKVKEATAKESKTKEPKAKEPKTKESKVKESKAPKIKDEPNAD